MRTITKIGLVGLAGYGGYTLWGRYGSRLGFGTTGHGTDDPRITARAGLSADETAAGSDDPVAQATAILADSDERFQIPRDAPGIEHRRSEDTVER